jgi:hypothetical protein
MGVRRDSVDSLNANYGDQEDNAGTPLLSGTSSPARAPRSTSIDTDNRGTEVSGEDDLVVSMLSPACCVYLDLAVGFCTDAGRATLIVVLPELPQDRLSANA